ncbi:MAG: ABC transporter substrate-binding protein [Deinococcota bacterium]
MKRLWLAFFVLSVGVVATAQTYGGVLRAGMQTDPVGLDPHTTTATATRNMLENVYDTLVMFDSSGLIVPALAESWEPADDGLSWTFNLREGVTFHNGDALTASDVAFSLNRIKDPDIASPRAGNFALITDVVATDDLTVVINLEQPFSPLLSVLAFSLNVIVSEDVATANDNDLNAEVVGTGPFSFVEYIPQTRMVLEKYDGYWATDDDGNPLPYLDGITFTFYPDPASRTTAVQTGAVDWIEYVPAADVPLLEANPEVSIVGGLSANFRAMYLNTQLPPFDDPLVRQAVSHVVDKQQVVDLALFGTGGVVATGTAIPAGNYYAIESSPYNTPDLERAKELMAQSSYPDGFEFELYVTSTYDFLRDPAEIIQANLAELGITTNIVAEDWSVYLPRTLERDFQATILGSSGQADPDDYFYVHFHSSSPTNRSQLFDDEIDRLLDQGRTTADQETRREIYLTLQERLLDLAPYVFLFHSAQYEALRPNVQGFEHYPNTSYLGLRTTWLE